MCGAWNIFVSQKLHFKSQLLKLPPRAYQREHRREAMPEKGWWVARVRKVRTHIQSHHVEKGHSEWDKIKEMIDMCLDVPWCVLMCLDVPCCALLCLVFRPCAACASLWGMLISSKLLNVDPTLSANLVALLRTSVVPPRSLGNNATLGIAWTRYQMDPNGFNENMHEANWSRLYVQSCPMFNKLWYKSVHAICDMLWVASHAQTH